MDVRRPKNFLGKFFVSKGAGNYMTMLKSIWNRDLIVSRLSGLKAVETVYVEMFGSKREISRQVISRMRIMGHKMILRDSSQGYFLRCASCDLSVCPTPFTVSETRFDQSFQGRHDNLGQFLKEYDTILCSSRLVHATHEL